MNRMIQILCDYQGIKLVARPPPIVVPFPDYGGDQYKTVRMIGTTHDVPLLWSHAERWELDTEGWQEITLQQGRDIADLYKRTPADDVHLCPIVFMGNAHHMMLNGSFSHCPWLDEVNTVMRIT